MGLGRGIPMAIRANAKHHVVLEDAATHVALDHEAQPAEHLLLNDLKFFPATLQQLPGALSQSFILGRC